MIDKCILIKRLPRHSILFIKGNSRDTSFLDKYQLSVIYGDADNHNLTNIYEKVYLYPGVLKNH